MQINLIHNLKDVKKDCFNIVIGGDAEINKRILDYKNVNLLLDPEPLKEDFMHYKNSGLNQVLVKLAKKNDIGIGFSLDRISSLNKLQRAILFGKIMQNVVLCNKYKVKYFIVNFNSFKNEQDLISLGLSLNVKNVNVIQEDKQ